MSIARLKGHEKAVPIKLWTRIEEVESAALTQLKGIAALPWCFSHVAVMPDVHLGKGATVGAVVAMKGALAPAAVGVDIGCGMAAQRTSLNARDLPDDLGVLRAAVEARIPVGFAAHPDGSLARGQALFGEFSALDARVHPLEGRARQQLGTLGGGNHFLELCVDQDDAVWLLLHSGSRNIGKELAEIHIARAKRLAHNRDLPDRDLAVFLAGTVEMDAYRGDLFWAQRYAALNRHVMLELYREVLRASVRADVTFAAPIACHHNYVAEEVHYGESVLVTRKGAIRAGLGELGIIPGSMGTRSYIVRGRGCAEAFESASHGAGRRMSRGEAKRRFTVEDLRAQTAGVECRKDGGVLDEIPGAYKSIDEVMANQAELVEVVAELKQVLCVKG
jgi:tRNA-splicing ligase RtcB